MKKSGDIFLPELKDQRSQGDSHIKASHGFVQETFSLHYCVTDKELELQ